MLALGDNRNVWNTCLRILRMNGYRVWLDADEPEADMSECFWCAEKNGYNFMASNPIELLGLVGIYEHKTPTGPPIPYWWVVEGDNIIDELAEERWPNS